ncbi:hypothetical protein ACJX0J_035870 [Zea mays]
MFASTLDFGFDQVPKGIHCNFGVSLSKANLHDIIACTAFHSTIGEEGHFLCLFDMFGASFTGSSGSSIAAMDIEDQAPEFYNIIIYNLYVCMMMQKKTCYFSTDMYAEQAV